MSDKIHPPTPRRRKKAKEQGRAPRSGDLVSAGLLLSVTGLLSFWGGPLTQGLMDSIETCLSQEIRLTLSNNEACRLIWKTASGIGLLVAPLLIGTMMCAIAFNLLQTGWVITPAKLLPSSERIAPTKRLTGLFSARSLGRFGISIIKVIAVVAVGFAVARSGVPPLLTIGDQPLSTMAATIFNLLTKCCCWVGATLFIFALFDYALAWWQHERDLMMTDQELREEMRDSQRATASGRGATTQAVSATNT